MPTKQRTIKIPDELWTGLQGIAALENKSCADLIREDIEARVSKSIAPGIKEKLNQEIEAALGSELRAAIVDQIADRVIAKLSNETTGIKFLKTVETIDLDQPQQTLPTLPTVDDNSKPGSWREAASDMQDVLYSTEEKGDDLAKEDSQTLQTLQTVDNEQIVREPKKTDKATRKGDRKSKRAGKTARASSKDAEKSKSEKKQTVETLPTVKEEKLTKEERQKANLARFKQHQSLGNRKSYSDASVAVEEGLNKESVRRYRKGIRSPKQEFIDKWGLSWDGNGWVKN